MAQGVPIYQASVLRESGGQESKGGIMTELHSCLLSGPGVFVVRRLVQDTSIIDEAEKAFATIIAREKSMDRPQGDHFAPAGANDRIWNSFQKLAMSDPETFVRYYANDAL
jgi:ectoine hydroxylase-related dioxygenase (phytanoyl-CoA dioxygenase family)